MDNGKVKEIIDRKKVKEEIVVEKTDNKKAGVTARKGKAPKAE